MKVALYVQALFVVATSLILYYHGLRSVYSGMRSVSSNEPGLTLWAKGVCHCLEVDGMYCAEAQHPPSVGPRAHLRAWTLIDFFRRAVALSGDFFRRLVSHDLQYLILQILVQAIL